MMAYRKQKSKRGVLQRFVKRTVAGKRARGLIRRTEFKTHAELEEMQFRMLRRIVEYSWNNIQGYRELWEATNFHPSKLKSLSDYHLIPIIEKNDIRGELLLFSNSKVQDKVLRYTGGSTGNPFSFYTDVQDSASTNEFIHDVWRCRYKKLPSSPIRTSLRGDKIKGLFEFRPKHGLVLSTYQLTEKNVDQYVKLIDDYGKTGLLHAYPSSAYLLARLMEQQRLKLRERFKLIALGSEKLYPFQLDMIKRHLGDNITHWYGMAEGVCLAGYCKHIDKFHIYPQLCIAEVLDENDNPVEKGEVGEVVGTNFWNYVTPLIRYRSGDRAVLGDNKCDECGRNYQLLDSIEGRNQECFYDTDLQPVICTGYYFLMSRFENVVDSQYIQDVPGEVGLLIVKSKSYSQKDEDEIKKALETMYRGRIKFHVKYVDSLERSATNKIRFLIQNINREEVKARCE
jgi:phenylacetate-CoA ligase